MTEALILFFSVVVWLAKGHYDPSIVFLVFSFFFWVGAVIFNFKKVTVLELAFQYYPWLAGALMCVQSDLNSVAEVMRPYYFYFRFVPLGITFISFKFKNKNFALFLFLFFFLSVLLLSPDPFIDVVKSNLEAVRFFLAGLNPYSQRYTDIYRGEFHYQPGFLYWPGALYLQTVSFLLFKEIRVVLVLSWWSALFFIPKKIRISWCALPFLAFGFEQGWLDPILSLCAALALWAIQRKKNFLVAVSIAAAASIKQYGFLIGFFVMLWMLLEGNWKSFFKVGIGAFFLFLIALLPFFIWNARDFFAMTIASHALAAVRIDSLNFTAFWMKTTGSAFSGWLQLLLSLLGFALGVIHVYLNRRRRGIKVIPEAWAIAFGFSILFGKFAFCNYYWLLISFWLLSLAWPSESEDGCKYQV